MAKKKKKSDGEDELKLEKGAAESAEEMPEEDEPESGEPFESELDGADVPAALEPPMLREEVPLSAAAEAPVRFLVRSAVRYHSHQGITTIPAGAIVTEHSHDLAAVRAAGADLEVTH